MTYSEKLKDPRWQKLRLRVFERDKWTCRDCGANDRPLHAHHAYYEKGKDPWDYPDYDILCLCEQCHDEKHSLMSGIQSTTSLLKNSTINKIGLMSYFGYFISKSGQSEEVDKIISEATSKLRLIYENNLQNSKDV